MTESQSIFQKQDVTTTESTLIAHANFDLDLTIQRNDVLPVGGWVPVEVVLRRGFSKDNRRDWIRLGKGSDGLRFKSVVFKSGSSHHSL
jgi:hypothetical protein